MWHEGGLADTNLHSLAKNSKLKYPHVHISAAVYFIYCTVQFKKSTHHKSGIEFYLNV